MIDLIQDNTAADVRSWLGAQPAHERIRSIISVNSWGCKNLRGMAGPKLSGTSAKCVLDLAASNPPSKLGGAVYSEQCS